ncbi:MAG TPA: copper resistance protein CopC [Acidobacteriaceae bacterium]|nr:copper resistance protein CopC [Acidobacteriaceae bacterium]
MHGPDVQIVLHYNARIDARRCSLTLIQVPAKEQPLFMQTPAGPAELDAHAKGLVPAQYVLHWQVLATDGHITQGEIPFTVQ